MTIDHLGPEAVAAFVDGELPKRAVARARHHLVHCKECRDEVISQYSVAATLRHAAATTAGATSISGGLLAKLASIPEQAKLAELAGSTGPAGAARAAGEGSAAGRGRRGVGAEPDYFTVDGRRIPRTLEDRLYMFFQRLYRRPQHERRHHGAEAVGGAGAGRDGAAAHADVAARRPIGGPGELG